MANEVVRWEPFKEMMSLREAIDRLFEESFVGPRWGWALSGVGEGLAVDMYETDNDIVVTAAVPGVKPEDIDISITGDTLTIKGESKREEKIERANYICQERRYGSFQRTLRLPVDVQADKAEAVFEHGVLKLTLPKAEAVKPKTIEVRVK